MKKIASIICACFYVLSTMGMGVKQFYCCGSLQSVNLVFVAAADNTDTQEVQRADDCCKTTHHFYRLSAAHQSADQVLCPAKVFSGQAVVLFDPGVLAAVPARPVLTCGFHSPPIADTSPVYLRHCVFRI